MLVPLQLVSHRMKTLCGGQSRLVATVGVGGDTLGCSDGSGRQVGGFIASRHTLPPTPASGRLVNKTIQSILDLAGDFCTKACEHSSHELKADQQLCQKN